MKKILSGFLIVISFSLSAGKTKENFEFDLETMKSVQNYQLTHANYKEFQYLYEEWSHKPETWVSPYPNVRSLVIRTKRKLSDEEFNFMVILFPNVTEFTYSKKILTEEKVKAVFSQWKYLDTVNFSRTNFSSKFLYLIKKHENLKKVDLSGNQITYIDELPESIEELDVSNNPIKAEFLYQIDKKCPNLTELSIGPLQLRMKDKKHLQNLAKFIKINFIEE